MTALVAGATGLVGRELVRQLAADPRWREVRALARRTLPHELMLPRVTPVAADYEHLVPPPDWAHADQVFCALGTTMRAAGSREAFRRVDLEFPLALARAALTRGAHHFLLVSALGARPDSPVFYNRVKGEAEGALQGLGFRSVTIARPSVLLGPRVEMRWGELAGGLVARVAPRRWRAVPAARVAAALIRAAAEDAPGTRILENRELLGPG